MKKVKQLNIKGLCHSFDNKLVLNDINLCLNEGKITAIVGRSGCGKSTLLNLIATLSDIETGSIINDFSETAILFQDARLLPWKTVEENIGWGLKVNKVAKQPRTEIVKKLASNIGLSTQDLGKYPHELSGGMKQRAAMARSFAVKPELLLLDEPFSALDIGLKNDLHNLLIDEINERSLTVLFITHDLMEAVKLADQIIVLSSDPGEQVYTYQCDQPITARNSEYQYSTVANLLKIKAIQQAFKTESL